MTTFYKGDCVERMRDISSASIDFVYFNPPFAITRQPWDEALPWPDVFAECFRILKPSGTLAIHCSVPFNYVLIRAAPRPPNYSWYWDKKTPTTALMAKRQPLRHIEEILVWTSGAVGGKGIYNPQRVGTEPRVVDGFVNTAYIDRTNSYRPEKRHVIGRYQTHYIQMARKLRGFATRPDALIELMIKSYTNEGDTILDPTCYEGLSGVVAKRLGRKWIGIDKYFSCSLLDEDTIQLV